MKGNFYTWKCNRCETSAQGDYREGLQRYIDHHVSTMHPLFTAERIDRELRAEPVGDGS